MNNLFLLIFCFIAGMLMHHFKRMPVNTPAVLNNFIIHVSFPALILLSVHDLKISGEIGLMAAMVLYLLYVPLLGAHGQAIQITLFESAMPPMITAAILATEHDLDPPLATLMVTVGDTFIRDSDWLVVVDTGRIRRTLCRMNISGAMHYDCAHDNLIASASYKPEI